MQSHNTILEDISAEIGFTATSTLVGWFGGRKLYVPLLADPMHPLAILLGYPNFVRFVAGFGGDNLFVPKAWNTRRLRRDRIVFDLLRKGTSTRDVMSRTGLSKMHVHNIRHSLEDSGMLPIILKPETPDAD